MAGLDGLASSVQMGGYRLIIARASSRNFFRESARE